MAVQVLSLASGQVQTATATIYTSTNVTTIVKSIRLVNTGSAPVIVNVYLYRLANADTRHLWPLAMTLAGYALAVDDQEVTMSSGDMITAGASASGVDFVISGIQR